MTRDFTKFPDDMSGDSLWDMSQRGDDMAEKRDVEFAVVFATEDEALKFGGILLVNRQQVLLCDNQESKDYPYEIIATIAMVLSYQAITEYEGLLQQYAADLNGINDGWGCHAQ